MEIEKIFNWLIEYAPETAEHVLLWGFIWSLAGMVVCIVAMVALGILAVKCYKKGKIAETSSSTGDWYIGCSLFCFCGVGSLAGFIASAYWMIMVECFPRLYLLSYLKSFVR